MLANMMPLDTAEVNADNWRFELLTQCERSGVSYAIQLHEEYGRCAAGHAIHFPPASPRPLPTCFPPPTSHLLPPALLPTAYLRCEPPSLRHAVLTPTLTPTRCRRCTLSPAALVTIGSMLTTVPDLRPTAAALLRSGWPVESTEGGADGSGADGAAALGAAGASDGAAGAGACDQPMELSSYSSLSASGHEPDGTLGWSAAELHSKLHGGAFVDDDPAARSRSWHTDGYERSSDPYYCVEPAAAMEVMWRGEPSAAPRSRDAPLAPKRQKARERRPA